MASKYVGTKGKIPQQQTARDQALDTAIEERRGKSVAELTAEFNKAKEEAAEAAIKAKALKVKADALEILILRKLDADDADAIRINGYTWSETFEPYPVCDDIDAVLEFLQNPENGMADQLKLKSSELAERLKNHVKQEALANELIVEVKEVDDPEAPGGKREVTEVRSKIPGVKVFNKHGLSRVKSGAAK